MPTPRRHLVEPAQRSAQHAALASVDVPQHGTARRVDFRLLSRGAITARRYDFDPEVDLSATPSNTRPTLHSETDFSNRILEQILRLRAADALDMRASNGPQGLYTWSFRAGGWPIEVHLDETVLEMRVYHGRHTISTGRVPPRLFPALIGAAALPDGSGDGVSVDESLAALRAIVADWKRKNPRVFMEPPRTARHPDGWNNA